MEIEHPGANEDNVNVRRPDDVSLWLSSYAMGGNFYGAEIQARDLNHAVLLASLRGLNEHIEGEKVGNPLGELRFSVLIAEERWLEAVHLACYLGHIGLASGALTPRELLGDTGLIHELVHLCTPLTHHPDESPEIVAEDKAERAEKVGAVQRMAQDFAHRVPGWPTVVEYEPLRGGGKRKRRKA